MDVAGVWGKHVTGAGAGGAFVFMLGRGIRVVFVSLLLGTAVSAHAAEVVRRPLEAGIHAIARDGGTVGIEVALPQSANLQRTLTKYLSVESEWASYRGRLNSFIPVAKLKPQYQRQVLLAVFEQDAVDARGWWHEVVFSSETAWSIAGLITGNGSNHQRMLADPVNDGLPGTLRRGEVVLVPIALLPKSLAQATPDRMVPRAAVEEPAVELAELADGLRYGSDTQGGYAVYEIQKGESLYTSVVVRFTDIHDNADILQACETVARRSGIRDVSDIDVGRKILIPLDMLSARYQPRGSAPRDNYEATLAEANRLRGNQGRSRDLSGVVIILDPGHGGTDLGTYHSRTGLYEDEINYDIVCRIRALLERETSARVYVTMIDRSQGYAPANATKFTNDTDEELLTTPRHPNNVDAKVSLNLRWMLVNSIYDHETKAGTDPNKVVLTSIHTDSIANDKIRGAMVYVPGAQYRRNSESSGGGIYAKYTEGRSYSRFTSTASERRRDEAMSRNLANVIIDELGRARIKRHDNGDPIRNVIVRSKNSTFVPAIIRNSKIPNKVLIETANINSPVDRERLADPQWRQTFAEAYVDALKRYYGADVKTRVASRGGGD